MNHKKVRIKQPSTILTIQPMIRHNLRQIRFINNCLNRVFKFIKFLLEIDSSFQIYSLHLRYYDVILSL